MITISAVENYHPRFAPAGAKKAYLAKITGRDSGHTFARSFLAKSTDFDVADAPVLLERVNVDKKGRRDDPDYILILADGENVTRESLYKDDAMWLASQMDAGRSLSECWRDGKRVSPTAAAKVLAGQTVETAVEACWAAMNQLPEKLQKQVLAALRARVSPPRSTPAPTEAPMESATV